MQCSAEMMQSSDTDCPNAVLVLIAMNIQELCVDVSGATAELPHRQFTQPSYCPR